MTLSYLVSTAGHAQSQNARNPHNVKTILQLVTEGADEFGDEKVVGFTAIGDNEQWRCDYFSFPQLLALSDKMMKQMQLAGLPDHSQQSKIVSLLCPTGPQFLVAWLALMRMGYGVVFIAPQCSPSAIHHLITSTQSTHLIYHPKYADLARSTLLLDRGQKTVEIPSIHYTLNLPRSSPSRISVDPHSVSHVFHTSGTSGTPKPIPHTHIGSTSVLPRRALPSYLGPASTSALPAAEFAAFTTTPLFHGGVSDLLRAWMARSMICFYPTSDTPITCDNLVGAINACRNPDPPSRISLDEAVIAERATRFDVRAFLSVPYIFTVLAEDVDGPAMETLRMMDFVSVGGAPLDKAVGDAMVENGVRLVSRLGSSECGFLLSSHRDYQHESDWEWLRNDSSFADALSFESGEGGSSGKYEMVVTSKWASKTKTNREDGSYATGDLYEPHPSKANVWRYVGRGDDVIVLSNGEKASPGPIETILRSSPNLTDALVVGVNRPRLGVLLFPRASPPPVDLLERLSPLITQANQSSPSFAHISLDASVVVAAAAETLPKSSKGTIQRGLAYETFADTIDRLYAGSPGAETGSGRKESALEIEAYLVDLVKSVMGLKKDTSGLTPDTDLFNWGVDSLMAVRIRASIQKDIAVGDKVLPINIVFEKATISRLSRYLYDLHEGISREADTVDLYQLMSELVEKYGRFPTVTKDPAPARTADARKGKAVLLTGATGSLGAHLLSQLCRLSPEVIDSITCLVRANEDAAAEQRVRDTLRRRRLDVDMSRITVLRADLSELDFKVTATSDAEALGKADIIIHAAWPVHFASGLVSFEDSIKGARHLLDLAASSPTRPTFYFCSSLASVLAGPTTSSVLEKPSFDPSAASPIGYSQSKWGTESICRLANEEGSLGGRACILRIGQLCGDTVTGHWNETEGWPLLIRTAQTTGFLPLLSETPSWLPVDLAARAIVEIVAINQSSDAPIYHIAHPIPLTWTDVLDGLSAAGVDFDRVSPPEWLAKVEQTSEDVEANPSRKMLPMWQAAYGESSVDPSSPLVDTSRAREASKTLRELGPVDQDQLKRMVAAWRETGFLKRICA